MNLRTLRSWAVGFLMGVVFAAALALIYPDKFAVRVIERPTPQQNQTNPMQLKKITPSQRHRTGRAYVAGVTVPAGLDTPFRVA